MIRLLILLFSFALQVTFPSLEFLELQGLQNLGDVWGSELFDFSFSKLKELEVEDCGSLTDLFHPSMAGILVNLQKLVIKNCHKMNSVVGREEEIEDGQGRAIEKTLFPQLIVLELHRLPNLRRFCYFTHPIESQLRRIYISDCPSMDAFSLGNVSAPNLSLPGVSWNGNLNNAIQLLQEVCLPMLFDKFFLKTIATYSCLLFYSFIGCNIVR
ncbi:hypothetical protein Vadar_033533 [Vaccinium darrowii]|uniref:Uncharacterized protein n=1 Tax=Vaccinium darrowii TaxID=229202 RepID=A0ACB7YSG3_9ERIC|nr:hypothetical protein Vadar_033533 [Vaccinium darrowii]